MELATIHEGSSEIESSIILLKPCNQCEPLSNQPVRKIGIGFNHNIEGIFQSSKHGISHSMPFIPKSLPPPSQNAENNRILRNTMTTNISGLYCKILVVLGMSFPTAEVLTEVPPYYYEAFYLYLYLGSMLFLTFVNTALLNLRATIRKMNDTEKHKLKVSQPSSRYGSFYLRVGAAAFGVGSMIYSALEFGQYFELDGHVKCSNVLMAVTPAIRILFIIIQLQFIFVSDKEKTLAKFNIPSKFGLMHMIATNLCVWLNVLIQETKHEIMTFYDPNTTSLGFPGNFPLLGNRNKRNLRRPEELYECRRANIMGSLVQNAAPFLFPCTIEYSLISAVILYALWKHVCLNKGRKKKMSAMHGTKTFKLSAAYTSQYFTVDCANAHKGLFASIMVLVFTITSLIMFFALIKEKDYASTAVFQVNLCELTLYVITSLATLLAMYKIKDVRYEANRHLELDNILLVMAQTGLYIYFTFSLIAAYFTKEIFRKPNIGITSVFGIIQSSLQTLFIIDAWWRRCSTAKTAKEKPARQLVTFLMISNIAMWAINHLENARADFHPIELRFYGVWAWTIITHLSMPLAVFYRFHSTVCLCEIWKCTYKIRLPDQRKL